MSAPSVTDIPAETGMAVGRIVSVYVVFAVLWIAISGHVLMGFVEESELLGRLEMVKGWFYILITAVLLFTLLNLERRRLDQSLAKLKLTTQALHESNDQQRWLEDNIPGSYIYTYTLDDGKPRFLHVSAGVEAVHQLTVAEVLADAGLLLHQIAPEQRTALAEAETASWSAMADFDIELRFIRPDGQSRWLQVRSRPRRSADGQVVWDGLAIDVSARKVAEEALRNSEERLRIVTGSARVGLVMIDPQHRYIFSNATYAEILGLPSADIVGKQVGEVLGEVYEDQIRPRLDRAFAGARVTWQLRRPVAGKERHYAVNYEPAHAGDSVYAVVVVITDITDLKLTEEKLRLHEAVLRETGRIAKVGGWSFDVATGVGYWTEEVARIHDLDPDLPTSKQIGLGYYRDESRRRIEAALEAAVNHGVAYDLELEMTTAKGVRKWVRTIGHPVLEDGKVVRLRGSFQDVSERHELDAERERQQRRLALLADISQRLVLSDSTGEILQGIFADLSHELQIDIFANYMVHPAGDRLLLQNSGGLTEQQQRDFAELPFGVSLCGLVAQKRAPVVFADLPSVTVPQAAGIIELGVQAYAGYPLLAGDRLIGTISFGSRRLSSYSDDDIRLMRAVTAQVAAAVVRRRLHLQLDQNRTLLEIFIDHAPAALAMFDREMRYLSVSRRWLMDYGLNREVIGKSHYHLFPGLSEEWKVVHRRALAGETVRAEADRFVRADGSEQWLRWEVRPWYLDPATIGGIVIMAEDITSRIQAENSAREATSLYRSLVDQMPIGVFRKNAEGRCVFVNDEFLRLTGTKAADFLGQRASDVIAPLDVAGNQTGTALSQLTRFVASTTHHDHIMQTGETVRSEQTWTQADGSTRHVLVMKTPVYSDTRQIVGTQGMFLDITPLRAAETAQRDSEERFRQMAESIDEVFWMTDTDKQALLYISPAYEHIWGRKCEDLYAQPDQWLDAIVPEDRARVLHAAQTKQATGDYHEEYRIMRPDGAIRWISDRGFPVKDATGTVNRVAGCAQDITERKLLEAQFLRAQRMEAIGTLAGGVAHDLNNILSPVMMIAGLLRDKLVEPEDKKILGMVEVSAERGAGIIRQLLTFSRGSAGDKVSVQVRHLLKEMTALMRETFPRDITIMERSDRTIWPVTGDPTQLHQVLMNLCVNARDAMPNGGVLTLGATSVRLDDMAALGHPEAAPGAYTVLSVQDTGTGIPAELLPRIFDPFFTTKEVGKGTGLGLATVHTIARSNGGFVTVESEPGNGACFKVYLPAVPCDELVLGSAAGETLRRGRSELILVVDDEAHVSEATRLLLERQHYRVLVAANGLEALQLFLEHREEIRLVITDSMMPVMDGTALARALREMNPALPIVAVTGLDQGRRVAELKKLGVTKVLLKPFSSEDILQAIHLALSNVAVS